MKMFIIEHKTKILLTLFFTLVLVFLNNNVFASTLYPSPLDIPDINYTYKGWVINYNETDNKYTMLLYATDNLEHFNLASLTYGDSWNGTKKDIRVHTNFSNYGIYLHTWTFELVDGVWSNGSYLAKQKSEYRALETSSVSICESTRDIYHRNSEEIFFSVPPQKGTLVEVMENLEKGVTLKEIIVLLPVILSVLVSLIALRKALKMLLDFLRTS